MVGDKVSSAAPAFISCARAEGPVGYVSTLFVHASVESVVGGVFFEPRIQFGVRAVCGVAGAIPAANTPRPTVVGVQGYQRTRRILLFILVALG